MGLMALRRLLPVIVVLACASVAALSLAAVASAGTRYGLVGQFGAAGAGNGQFSSPADVAVDQSTGDVYVVDSANERVEKFEAGGKYLSQFNGSQTPAKAFSSPSEIAVDNSTNPLDASAGDVYVVDKNNAVVDKFTSAGVYVGQITGTPGHPFSALSNHEVTGVGVDENGNVFVEQASDEGGTGEVDEFSSAPANAFLASWTSPYHFHEDGFAIGPSDTIYTIVETGAVVRFSGSGSEIGGLDSGIATGVAVDPQSGNAFVDDATHIAEYEASGAPLPPNFGAGTLSGGTGLAYDDADSRLYVADGAANRVDMFALVTVPDATSRPPSAVGTEGATLNATVNPDGVDASCTFEYGSSESYGHSAPCEPADIGSGETPESVHAQISGLAPDTTYHYRILATNVNGTVVGADVAFTTLGPPSVVSESVSALGVQVTFKATVTVHGHATYRFEYGTTEGYGASAPVPDGELANASGEVSLSQKVSGLQGSTEYHYRVVVVGEHGEARGPDQTFTTFPAQVAQTDNCPNAAIRAEQSSGFLPDCRAYEKVTPAEKGGGDIVADGETTIAATGGGAVAFNTRTPFGDEVGTGNSGQTVYVARREGGAGWLSHAVTPASQPEAIQVIFASTYVQLFSDDLSTALVWGYDLPGGGGVAGRRNIYAEDVRTRALRALAVPQTEAQLGFLAFLQVEHAGVSADAQHVAFTTSTQMLSSAPEGVSNVYQSDHGVLSLAGVLPDSACGSPPCVPAGGSYAAVPPGSESYRGDMSADGSRLLFMASPTPGANPQLYMRVDGQRTVQVSESENSEISEASEVQAQYMTPDGNSVFFVTSSKLLSEDKNEGPDLYRWTSGPDPEHEKNLTLITNNGAFGIVALAGVIGASEDGSRVYYQTSGSVLAVWDNGTTRLISSQAPPNANPAFSLAATAAAPGLGRVSSDGAWLAFVAHATLKRDEIHGLTGQVTNNHYEMYVYGLQSNTLLCVSCSPGAATSDASVLPNVTSGTPALFNHGIRPQFLSDKGQVFFSTAEALLPQDINGVEDVYEYDAPSGTLSLLSPGTGSNPTAFADASASGEDVFIQTRGKLLSEDHDSLVDIYDVRANGGLPAPAPPPAPAPAPNAVPGTRPLRPSARRPASASPARATSQKSLPKK